jgi:hypothetical protein
MHTALIAGFAILGMGGQPVSVPAPAPAPAPVPLATVAATPELSRAAFERFQALSGDWVGRSTKGWEETLHYRPIAGGSTILETSFDAHPGQEMATTIYLDGDRLRMTHYCMAKNTPRLEATAFADGGRTVIFTFVDGANIPTRDKGHMDQAVFRFETPDRITSRWTWYENGTEKWFEEIVQTRQK